jgi:tetratricopeptide (TPR) repeat protein
MPAELREWLRQQREARGLTRPEMARQLIQAGRARGDNTMPGLDSMCHNIYRWERGADGLSERYKLAYCHVLGILPGHFGPQPEGYPDSGITPGSTTAMAVSAAAAIPVPAQSVDGIPGLPGPHLPALAAIAYRERQEPGLGHFAVEREVLMAAHDSSDHAAEHEQHGIGEATLEQLRSDLARLSSLSDTGAPLSAFLDMRRVRDRIYRLLDRQLWPGEQADLYFLLGCIHELMGLAANRLGYPDAAEELIRAGWAYANAIGHNPLRGMLRARLSYVMYWRGWYSESRDLAADGLRYASHGLVGANLRLEHARALARLGDRDAAGREVGLAHAAREGDYSDDLTQIGGEEFALSRAATCSMAGGALAEVGNGREAAGELEAAVSLYDAGPGPGEHHGVAGKALAGADLAAVRVRSGALDGAVAALEPVLILPPAQRVSTLTARLIRVRNELAAPVFRGSPQARELGDQIEEFGREAVTAGLHSLSGPS